MNTLAWVGGLIVVAGLALWLLVRASRKWGTAEGRANAAEDAVGRAKRRAEIDADVASMSDAELDRHLGRLRRDDQ